MAAGCEGRRASLRGALPALLGVATTLAVVAAQPVSAASAVTSAFDPTTPLPGGGGAYDPSLLVSPDSSVGILASTGPGNGCALFSVAYSGGVAQYLGLLPGGTGCQIAGTEVNNAGQLAYTALSGKQGVAGQSTTSGASFATAPSSAFAMGSMAADPALDASGTQDLYALLADPATGLPLVGVSLDGGRTFSEGAGIIDPTQVSAAQWSTAIPPVAGNLVARRDDTGLHLYTTFETADSASDVAGQTAAKSDNLNRVYEAVGTVIPVAGSAPAVVWQDSLVYAAAPGHALNRALPSTSVDSAGHVFTAFSDGQHLLVKQDVDGLHWNANAAPVDVDSVATGAPQGLVAALAPAIAAGGDGAADVAWYAADQHNTWNVLMAQTLDAGKTWQAAAVTTAPIHQGTLCVASDVACTATSGAVTLPDAALALAVDPVAGDAVAAFSGDAASPGAFSLFETRQCTGQNVLTGNPLTDDCVALQPATPVLPGTSCPGPQITDSPGDAIRTVAPGGTNLASLDLLTVQLNPEDASHDVATISVNRMSPTLPAGVSQAAWRVSFTLGTTRYFAQALLGPSGQVAYSVGTVAADNTVLTAVPTTGNVTDGAGGGFAIAIPHAALGNAPAGTAVQQLSAASFAEYDPAIGLQVVDRAPDAGYGSAWAVGNVCQPDDNLPDAPMAVLLPVAGGLAGLFIWFTRRRRSRRISASTEGDI